jgi:hypothetical protein
MKKLITIILFIFISSLSFGQHAIKAGKYYELDKVFTRDSISVKLLMDTYKLDITKLSAVKFFGEFELSDKLHHNYSHSEYTYVLEKKTGVVTLKSLNYNENLLKLNKYVMVFCFDDNTTEKKTITIKIF